MKQMYIRPAKPEDKEKFVEWAAANFANSQGDAGVLFYDSTFTLCAYDQKGPVAFLPVQRPMMMEFTAFRPDATPAERAHALRLLFGAIVTEAHEMGAGEIYFMASEETIPRFASGHAPFEKLPFAMYRLKLSDLEG